MQKREQIFLYMEEEIKRLAKVEEEKILQETAMLEEQACQQIKEAAMLDSKKILAKELASISTEASIEAASINETNTRNLIKKREDYTNDVFIEARNKLLEFVNSNDYIQYMVDHVSDVAKHHQMANSVIYLRNEDLSLKDKLIEAYKMDVEVVISERISIGGFIIKNTEANIVIDESLDFALENQKEWFSKTSGLMIR